MKELIDLPKLSEDDVAQSLVDRGAIEKCRTIVIARDLGAVGNLMESTVPIADMLGRAALRRFFYSSQGNL